MENIFFFCVTPFGIFFINSEWFFGRLLNRANIRDLLFGEKTWIGKVFFEEVFYKNFVNIFTLRLGIWSVFSDVGAMFCDRSLVKMQVKLL